MAFLKSAIDLTGSLEDLSFYKMRGVAKTVVRSKGGASKKKMLNDPKMVRVKENFTEFGACGMMGGSIRRAMLALVPLADYNFTATLNKIAKYIQALDTERERGQRGVLLSRHKSLLAGFNLNNTVLFDSVVKHPLDCRVDRENGRVNLLIPALTPGFNLVLGKHPLFRFVLTMGAVTDKVFNKGRVEPEQGEARCAYSEWYHAGEAFPGTDLSVELNYVDAIHENMTLVVAIGIQYGVPLTSALVEPVKYSGAARIIAVA
jgi:hypothetical protein